MMNNNTIITAETINACSATFNVPEKEPSLSSTPLLTR